MFTTRVRRANILFEPVVIHLVDLVDQNETRLGEIVGRCHDQVPDTMCRESLVDLAGDEALLVLDVITGLRPLTPHELRVVAPDAPRLKAPYTARTAVGECPG